jgi:CRISPR-associated protein Cas8a1/Csx13
MPSLVIELDAPGMTPLLRAGLGGLAAALRFLLLENDERADWPAPIDIAGARATVEPRRVTLEWNGAKPDVVLRKLFEKSFRLSKAGVITLAGTFEPSAPPSRPLAILLQEGLKRTFLQHGKTTTKSGAIRTATEEVDDQRFSFQWQPYADYAHQREDAWGQIAKALVTGRSIELAGWSYPGASQKHVKFAETRCEYMPAHALCALFAQIGCLSLDVRPGRMGALIIAEPSDLVSFAFLRPRLTPSRPADAFVASLGDAVLATQTLVRMDEIRGGHPAIAATHGVLLRSLPWAPQQKNRCRTLDVDSVPGAVLDLFFDVAQALPTRLLATRTDDDEDGDGGYFVATSALRAFVADNLAVGQKWYAGFASATTGGKKPRFLHCLRDRDRNNLGALYPEERRGLIIMNDHLDDAEKALVASVHTAMRQRFGRIADETENLPEATRRNRFAAERERWRLAFAGSKTHEQVRAALANLWSLAGPNEELRRSWERILPLLGPRNWHAARDLALVALASYQSASPLEDSMPDSPAA